jgi:hypothetical protein
MVLLKSSTTGNEEGGALENLRTCCFATDLKNRWERVRYLAAAIEPGVPLREEGGGSRSADSKA